MLFSRTTQHKEDISTDQTRISASVDDISMKHLTVIIMRHKDERNTEYTYIIRRRRNPHEIRGKSLGDFPVSEQRLFRELLN